jgi:hypothetical protein
MMIAIVPITFLKDETVHVGYIARHTALYGDCTNLWFEPWLSPCMLVEEVALQMVEF